MIVIKEKSAIERQVGQDITHEAGKNWVLLWVKLKMLPTKTIIVASKAVRQLGALIEHITKNDGIRVNGRINKS